MNRFPHVSRIDGRATKLGQAEAEVREECCHLFLFQTDDLANDVTYRNSFERSAA